MKTITRKIGRNRGAARLWIEGEVLNEAGLPHGTPWRAVWQRPDVLSLIADSEGNRRVSGKPERPVIDISGPRTLKALADVAKVQIDYWPGQGVMHVRELRVNS